MTHDLTGRRAGNIVGSLLPALLSPGLCFPHSTMLVSTCRGGCPGCRARGRGGGERGLGRAPLAGSPGIKAFELASRARQEDCLGHTPTLEESGHQR